LPHLLLIFNSIETFGNVLLERLQELEFPDLDFSITIIYKHTVEVKVRHSD
ncbi:Hypothetical predicted protein, partial [Olea europaea subsp. europaea]